MRNISNSSWFTTINVLPFLLFLSFLPFCSVCFFSFLFTDTACLFCSFSGSVMHSDSSTTVYLYLYQWCSLTRYLIFATHISAKFFHPKKDRIWRLLWNVFFRMFSLDCLNQQLKHHNSRSWWYKMAPTKNRSYTIEKQISSFKWYFDNGKNLSLIKTDSFFQNFLEI